MTGENGFPVTPEWSCEPHKCPFNESSCRVCSTPYESAEIPANVILGTD